jgi:hypothetical protein
MKQLVDDLLLRDWKQLYLITDHFEAWASCVSSFSEWNFLVQIWIFPELKLTHFQSYDGKTYVKYFRTEWYLHSQKMCDKLQELEKWSSNSNVPLVWWDSHTFLTNFSSEAVPLSSVTICCFIEVQTGSPNWPACSAVGVMQEVDFYTLFFLHIYNKQKRCLWLEKRSALTDL